MRKSFDFVAYVISATAMLMLVVTHNKAIFYTSLIVMLSRFIYMLVRQYTLLEKMEKSQDGELQIEPAKKVAIIFLQFAVFLIPVIGIWCVVFLFLRRPEMWS
jgi:hypothetical protein